MDGQDPAEQLRRAEEFFRRLGLRPGLPPASWLPALAVEISALEYRALADELDRAAAD